MVSGLVWSWLALANPVVTIDGNSMCPTSADVAARVAELLPGPTTSSAAFVSLRRSGGGSGGHHRDLGERRASGVQAGASGAAADTDLAASGDGVCDG
jgi:hypothetical protein